MTATQIQIAQDLVNELNISANDKNTIRMRHLFNESKSIDYTKMPTQLNKDYRAIVARVHHLIKDTMTAQQAKNKIENLNFWLANNPHHSDYCLKHQERNRLLTQFQTLN